MATWHCRAARATVLIATALLPLVVWLGLERPFSTPKIWLLIGASAVVLSLAWRPHRNAKPAAGCESWLRALPAVWLASWIAPSLAGDVTSLDPLLLAIGGGLWGAALVAARPRVDRLLSAQAIGATAVAAVAVLQWTGHDPFVAAGWRPAIAGGSARLRVYATLGNPNFVAAFLAATVPGTAALVSLAERRVVRLASLPALALQLAALVATGSRAGAVGLAAAALAWALLRGRLAIAVVAGAAAVCTVAIVASEARPLQETLAGRQYIWRVLAPRALDHPFTGHGPGSIDWRYPDWEAGAAAPAGSREAARFAGPQQHAHNDYLEALVERGIPGAIVLVLVVAVPLVCVRRRPAAGPAVVGAASSVAAIAGIAVVDFPLARPAELAALWTAVAVVTLAAASRETPASVRLHRVYEERQP